MSRVVLRIGTVVLCIFMLTACGSESPGREVGTAAGDQSADAARWQEAEDIVGKPIPTIAPATESDGEETEQAPPAETLQPQPPDTDHNDLGGWGLFSGQSSGAGIRVFFPAGL